ncbi:hypothetical protein N7539_003619 [Penicillium diatomitis]|uniref:Altered inheritance of mitochondria protein 6 n=1 Tax=Penicillium diatomitis TaxID=2819901 RepID=A0A9X0BXQ3_9EURO|nr:uncharacterized protein N7539_003619 [Penicillium diatomitis]KAJ5488729.1 hypothetical protein N7539_003619 [Penicillium diatomitis]
MLGFIQFATIAVSIGIAFFPDKFLSHAVRSWSQIEFVIDTDDAAHWLVDFQTPGDVVPVGCHSHNDYWRTVPLFSALRAGCIGVEADVWLFNEELYVGHTPSSLAATRTLESMYIGPLVRILDYQNRRAESLRRGHAAPVGVYDTAPQQTLVLLIDLKTDGGVTWPVLQKQLAPLRERGYLTYFNGEKIVQGPITVVGTGNTPFDLVIANTTHKDVFFDAPLDKLVGTIKSPSKRVRRRVRPASRRSTDVGQGLSGTPEYIDAGTFNASNSYYASVSFRQAIALTWHMRLDDTKLEMLRNQIRIAHSHGLKVRYRGIPGWPRALRDYVWRILLREGVDILNVDDLAAATRMLRAGSGGHTWDSGLR